MRSILLAAATAALIVQAGAAIADDVETCKSSSYDKTAIAACTRAISANTATGTDLARLYYERGTKYRNNRDYDPAIRDFTKAIANAPKWTWPYVARGHSYAARKEFPKAFADQEQAIAIEATAVTHTGRALDLIDAGAYDLALKDLAEALRIDPKYFYAYFNRGEVYLKTGRFDDAVSDYQMAVQIKPDNEDAKKGLRDARNHVRH
jgi:tetratricopeptide (TPR) repeat protein